MRPHRPKHGMILLPVIVLFLIQTQNDTVSAQSPSSGPSEITDEYAKITPSMALIIVVLIAVLFFMGFFSMYFRHCSSSSSSDSYTRHPSVAGNLPRSPRGLDSSVIDTFPLLHYSEVKGLKIGKGALECAVCLNEFDDDETLRFIPKCDHVFHFNCIDAWLASHVTCPVCRANLAHSDQLAESTQPLSELTLSVLDLEPGNELGRVERCNELNENNNNNDVEARDCEEEESLNRSRRRESRSGSTRGWWFRKSHSTGHSLVQPGGNTDRFTLKLPYEVRKQIMSRQLDRTMSLVVLPGERSSRRGYRISGDGSSRGNYRQLEKLGESAARSYRWVFTKNPSFLTRASSFLTRASSFISPVAQGDS